MLGSQIPSNNTLSSSEIYNEVLDHRCKYASNYNNICKNDIENVFVAYLFI